MGSEQKCHKWKAEGQGDVGHRDALGDNTEN